MSTDTRADTDADTDAEFAVSQDGHVATVIIRRPPYNYANTDMIRRLADLFAGLDAQTDCRAIVLASEGKAFCAGADFSRDSEGAAGIDPALFYHQAMRLFDGRKPIVAAVHGAAIGAGAGLALVADFRIVCPETRFSFNFNRLGFHPGFGLSYTLPRLIGMQKASLLFYTGRRIDGTEAMRIGLADDVVARHDVLLHAQQLAGEIAASAPMAVQSTRQTLHKDLAEQVRRVNARELDVQLKQFGSADFQEGVRAMAERRLPVFQ